MPRLSSLPATVRERELVREGENESESEQASESAITAPNPLISVLGVTVPEGTHFRTKLSQTIYMHMHVVCLHA